MDKPRVILFNRDLTSAVPPQLLQGNSGKTYGVSRWNSQYNCHAVEMSLAEFEVCSEDLRLALCLAMRRWWPKFVMPVAPPEPAPSEPDAAAPSDRASAHVYTEDELLSLGRRYCALVKVAKEFGITPAEKEGKPSLIRRILEKQTRKGD